MVSWVIGCCSGTPLKTPVWNIKFLCLAGFETLTAMVMKSFIFWG
jgi:hypothetical protein